MVATIELEMTAKRPCVPLPPLEAFADSPSTLRLVDAPPPMGDWHVTAVRLSVAMPSGQAHGLAAVREGNAWIVTIPACAASGEVRAGWTVYADGVDERGVAFTALALGRGDVRVIPADGAITPGEEVRFMHLVYERPDSPREGDVFQGADGWEIYKGGAWIPLGGGTANYAMGAIVNTSRIDPSTDPSTGWPYVNIELADRTINRIIANNDDVSDLRLILPPAIINKSRDFYITIRGANTTASAPLSISVRRATLHNATGGVFTFEIPEGNYERTYHLTEVWTGPGLFPVFSVAIDIPPALYDTPPGMAGAASAGSSENASRGDHVHPAETAGSAEYTEVGEMGAFVPDDFFPVHASIPGIAVTDFTAANIVFLIEQGATRTSFVLAYENDGDYLSIAKFDYATGAYIAPGTDVSGVPTFNGIVPTVGGFPKVLQSARSADPVAVRGVKVAPLASPAFTGTPTAPTPTQNDSSGRVATTEFVRYDLKTVDAQTLTLDDRANQKITLNAASTTLTLPALTSGKTSDFVLGVINGYEVSGTPTAASFSLAGTIGTNYNIVVPKGEDWGEMSALEAGEMAEYYFTLSAFALGNLPTWKIVKQTVEQYTPAVVTP